MTRTSLSIALLVLLAGAPALSATPETAARRSGVPVAVSPGGTETITTTADHCPTFSWSAINAAESYELMVYHVGEEESEALPVLTETLPGGALSWTPPLGRCLEPGSRYAWSVRVGGDTAAKAWSAPALFEVAAAVGDRELEEALAVVRAFLAQRGEATGGLGEAADPAPLPAAQPSARASGEPGPSLALGGADFSVDESGWVMAAGFEGDGSALTGVTAEQLAADGGNCTAGWAARGVNSLGQAQGCFEVPSSFSGLSGTLQSSQLAGTYSSKLTLDHTLNAFSGDGSGLNNVKAAQLIANGANCAAGLAARGVNQTGAAESCFDVATQSELVSHKASADHDGRYVNATGDTVAGSLNVTSKVDVSDMVRVRGSNWPGTGTGKSLEMAYNSSSHKGYLQVFDRNGGGTWGSLFLGTNDLHWVATKSFYSVAAAAFEPIVDIWNPLAVPVIYQKGTYLDSHPLQTWVAPVYLPHGATVTRVKSYWHDNDPIGDLKIELKKKEPYSGDLTVMATVDSFGSETTSVRTQEDTSINAAIVNNESQVYYALVDFPLTADAHLFPKRFHGLVIEYEVTRPH